MRAATRINVNKIVLAGIQCVIHIIPMNHANKQKSHMTPIPQWKNGRQVTLEENESADSFGWSHVES